MDSLNRKEDGVSPVIATILMVAITVVLAATLYMMVGDYGDDPASPIAGNITQRDGTQFEIVSLEQPSSAALGSVEITVLGVNEDGEEFEESRRGDETTNGDDYVVWSLLHNGEAAAGSRFDIGNFENIESEDNIDEVILRIDGYDSLLNHEM